MRKELSETLAEWVEITMHRTVGGFVAYAKTNGISLSQLRALVHIHHMGMSGVSGVGDELDVTAAAASQILDRLVQQNLVVRAEDPDDRRAKRIELTDAGSTAVSECMAQRHHWFETLTDSLSKEERQMVSQALEILISKSESLETKTA